MYLTRLKVGKKFEFPISFKQFRAYVPRWRLRRRLILLATGILVGVALFILLLTIDTTNYTPTGVPLPPTPLSISPLNSDSPHRTSTPMLHIMMVTVPRVGTLTEQPLIQTLESYAKLLEYEFFEEHSIDMWIYCLRPGLFGSVSRGPVLQCPSWRMTSA